jgi:uncharacterized protein YjiS (DUF1127 family)
MPSVPLVTPARVRTGPAWHGLLIGPSAVWRAVRDRRMRERNAAVLRGLDERTLQDLAIARSDIDALVAGSAPGRGSSSSP